jgi:hypothetical protein
MNFNNINYLSIYPDPCNNSFNIVYFPDNEINKILLLDLYGKIIKEFTEFKNKNLYHVENIKNGIYLLKIIFDNETTINQKLIINH